MKKLLAALAVIALAAGISVAAVAAPAAAHTPTVTPSCTTLTVTMVSYETQSGKPTPNNVKVTIDGSQVENANFGTSFGPKSYTFSPASSAHAWKVVVDAVGTGYDRTWSATTTPCVTPAAPSFRPAVCTSPGVPGSGGYTIPTSTGVKYQSKVNSGSFADIGAGSYSVAGGSTISVQALAQSNYTLVGTKSWSYTVPSPGSCVSTVTPAGVSFAPAVCTGPGTHGSGSYTIPATTGVKYQTSANGTNWVDASAGTVALAVGGKIWARAIAVTGYTLTGTTSWGPYTVASPGACTVTSTPSDPKVVSNSSCTTPGSLTLGNERGVVYTFVTGRASQTSGPYEIIATPATGYQFAGAQSVKYTGTLGDALVCATGKTPKIVDQSCTEPASGLVAKATPTIISGSIEVIGVTGITYRIHRIDNTTTDILISDGVTRLAPGDYLVTATAKTGYSITGTASWTVKIKSAVTCIQLPDFAIVDGSATATSQVCTAAGLQSGYIDVQLDPALSYSSGSLQLTSARTNVAPGTYVVTASVIDPDFTYNGVPVWTLKVAAAAGVCTDLVTLALTGAQGMGYLSIAAFLLLAGGAVIIRSRSVRKTA